MGTALIIRQITAFILKESGVFCFSGKRKYESEEAGFSGRCKGKKCFPAKKAGKVPKRWVIEK